MTWIVDAAGTAPGAGTAASPFPTIQAGIVAAGTGDTVLIRPGAYPENLDLLGKTLTLRSTGGATATLVNGMQSGPVITVPGGDVHIEGLYLYNGLGNPDTVLTLNCGGSHGKAGGVHVDLGGTVVIRQCVIAGNRGGRGQVDPCGVYFPYNAPLGGPGAIRVAGSATVEGCLIVGNQGGDGDASGTGGAGAIACNLAGACNPATFNLNITHCTIVNNVGGTGGIGGFDETTWPVGGGAGGSGALSVYGGAMVVLNTILYGNQGGAGGASPYGAPGSLGWPWSPFGANGEPSIQQLYPGSLPAATISVLHCIVEGGYNGTSVLSADPRFEDPANDFHLRHDSPAVDAGLTLFTSPLLTDLDGDPRVFHGSPDMGADETVLAQAISQAAPGSSVTLTNHNLTPGTEYYNLFTLPPCGPGAIQIPQLGICGDPSFLLWQINQPIDTSPFHFIATSDSMTFGPYSLSPMTLQGVCFAWDAGALGFVSHPITFVVQ